MFVMLVCVCMQKSTEGRVPTLHHEIGNDCVIIIMYCKYKYQCKIHTYMYNIGIYL